MKSHAKEIEVKIKEIKGVAELIPSVIIIHDLPDFNILFMSNTGLRLLNQKWDEIKQMSSKEYHRQFFNEEDAAQYVPKILKLLETNSDESVSYFQQVRTSKAREWDWYLSTTKILVRDVKNKPLACITTSMQVDPDHYFTGKAVRLLDQNEFVKKNSEVFAMLTAREKSVLKLLALGKSAPQIAHLLHISATTAETHRKKIKQKLNAENTYDLSQYARAFDLI